MELCKKTCLLSFSDSDNEFAFQQAELCFICRRCGDFKVLTEPSSSAKEAKLPVLNTLKDTSLTPALEPLSVLPPCHRSALWKPQRLISSRKPLLDFKNIKKKTLFFPPSSVHIQNSYKESVSLEGFLFSIYTNHLQHSKQSA